MTRVNTICPTDLTNEWLQAECREMVRIPNELIKHPNRLNLKKIPTEYTLNKGHVLFFRNKLGYLLSRQKVIIAEMNRRGLKVNEHWVIDESKFTPVMKMFCMSDYTPTIKANRINIERLNERFTLRGKAFHMTKNVKEVTNCDETWQKYSENHLEKY